MPLIRHCLKGVAELEVVVANLGRQANRQNVPFSRPKSISMLFRGGGGFRPYSELPCAQAGINGSGCACSFSSHSPSASSLSMSAGSVTCLLRSNRDLMFRASSKKCHRLAIHELLVRRAVLYNSIKRAVRALTAMVQIRKLAPSHRSAPRKPLVARAVLAKTERVER